MKNFLKGLTLSAISAAVGFAAVFGGTAVSMKQQENPLTDVNQETEQRPLTPQKRLLNRVMAIQTFNVDGEISLETSNDFIVKIGLDVDGDLSDFSKLRIKGDLNLNLNGVPLTSELAYIEDTMYFTFGNSNFSLKTDNLMDFVEFLPEMGLNLELPEELTNLDLNTITSVIDGMEYVETPSGDYFFVADVMGLQLRILTDSEYSFKGIRMDKTDFDGTLVGLDFKVEEVPALQCDLTSPAAEAPIGTFKPLEPAFNIFKSLINTFGKKQNTIQLDLGLSRLVNEQEKENIVSTNIDLSYDLDEMLFGLNGSILENNRNHEFDAFFADKTVYFGYQDLKVSIKTETIFNTIRYILNRLNVDITQKAMDVIVNLLNDEDFKQKLAGIKDLVSDYTLEDNLFSIELDTDAIQLGLGKITPVIKVEENELISITIPNINILGISLDISLKTKDYSPKELKVEDYEEIEPVFTLANAILPLLEETQFRLEFDANIGDGNPETNDVTIDGGLQFDIENQFGYGDITITDKNLYKHTVQGDMENPDEFYFSFNEKTNGRFSSRTIGEVVALALDVIQNPDEHFQELFGDLIEKVMNMPIIKVVEGDIGLLFDTNILNGLTITEDKLVANVDLALANIDASFDVEVKYHNDYTEEKSYIDGLSVKNLNLNGTTVELNAYLRPFSQDKAKERLDVTDTTKFLDFSDIKVLLALGINTSKFDYYHFSANLNLHIPLTAIKLDINALNMDLDIKIRNNKGHVQVAVEFEKIPTILLLNKQAFGDVDSRSASFYYDDGTFYLKRVDECSTGLIFKKYYQNYYSRKMDTDYFLDNIAEILLLDLLGMTDGAYDSIVGDGSTITSTGTQIKYEEILAGFSYNDNYSDTQGQFDFKVNLKSLLNLSIFDNADLLVNTNKATEELDSLTLATTIHVLINLKIDLSVKTLEKDTLKDENKLAVMDAWALSRVNDTMNELVTYKINK